MLKKNRYKHRLYIKQANLNTLKKYLLSCIFIGIAIISWSQQTHIEWISHQPNDTIYTLNSGALNIELKITALPNGTSPRLTVNGRSADYLQSKGNTSEKIPLGVINFEARLNIPNDTLLSIALTLQDEKGNIYPLKDEQGKIRHSSEPLLVSRGRIPKPNLYMLAFGPKPNFNFIEFTDNDAADFKRAFSLQDCGKSALYNKINAKTFVKEEAKAKKILEQIDNMIASNIIKPNDVFMLFFSSHGYRKDSMFCIQGDDYRSWSEEETSVCSEQLYERLNPVHAKKIFFIDACQSGKEPPTDSLFRIPDKKNQLTGYTIIASSEFDADSYTHTEWQNGAFTEALLEALEGKANKADGNENMDDVIGINEITTYLKKRVPELCKEVDEDSIQLQRPQMIRNELGNLPLFQYEKFCVPLVGGREVIYKTIPLPQGTDTIGSLKNGQELLIRNDDEEPRPVTINHYIGMGKYEISNVEYCDFLNDSKPDSNTLDSWIDLKSRHCKIKKARINTREEFVLKQSSRTIHFPVVMVSWKGAKAYADWLTDKNCLYKYDLPSADEWEYAARVSVDYEIYVSTDYFKEIRKKKIINTSEERSVKSLNTGDIYHMNTNVSEWCRNRYTVEASRREIRGGNFKSSKKDARTAKRYYIYEDEKRPDLGFRLIRTLKKDNDCE